MSALALSLRGVTQALAAPHTQLHPYVSDPITRIGGDVGMLEAGITADSTHHGCIAKWHPGDIETCAVH